MNKIANLGLSQSMIIHFGGMSDGPCALGIEDGAARDTARKNRKSLLERFNASTKMLVTPLAVFNKDVRIIAKRPQDDLDRPVAEAIFTKRDDLILGIWSSDCLPILLVDNDAGVTGAVHMSRENLVASYTETVIDTIDAMGSGRITAYLGPCLQKESHLISNKLAERMVKEHPYVAAFLEPSQDALAQRLDYAAFGASELVRLGVHVAYASSKNTYTNLEYHSLRRRRIDGNDGLNLSMVSL